MGYEWGVVHQRDTRLAEQDLHMRRVRKFSADVSRILGDPEVYRLSRPRLHEAIARLYLYNGVNDSVSKLEATAYVVQRHSLA